MGLLSKYTTKKPTSNVSQAGFEQFLSSKEQQDSGLKMDQLGSEPITGNVQFGGKGTPTLTQNSQQITQAQTPGLTGKLPGNLIVGGKAMTPIYSVPKQYQGEIKPYEPGTIQKFKDIATQFELGVKEEAARTTGALAKNLGLEKAVDFILSKGNNPMPEQYRLGANKDLRELYPELRNDQKDILSKVARGAGGFVGMLPAMIVTSRSIGSLIPEVSMAGTIGKTASAAKVLSKIRSAIEQTASFSMINEDQKEGAKQGLLFAVINLIPNTALRSSITALAMGGQAKLSGGDTNDIIANALLGGVMALGGENKPVKKIIGDMKIRAKEMKGEVKTFAELNATKQKGQTFAEFNKAKLEPKTTPETKPLTTVEKKSTMGEDIHKLPINERTKAYESEFKTIDENIANAKTEGERVAWEKAREIAVNRGDYFKTAYRDTLTDLKTRRAFTEDGHTDSPMVRFDIDHFKLFNDQYSHAQGDIVLKELSKITRKIYGEDIYRFGGEEIDAVVKNITEKQFRENNAKIRAEIKKNPLLKDIKIDVDGKEQGLDFSSGYGLAEKDGRPKNLTADSAVYQAKEQGRGRDVWNEEVYNNKDTYAKNQLETKTEGVEPGKVAGVPESKGEVSGKGQEIGRKSGVGSSRPTETNKTGKRDIGVTEKRVGNKAQEGVKGVKVQAQEVKTPTKPSKKVVEKVEEVLKTPSKARETKLDKIVKDITDVYDEGNIPYDRMSIKENASKALDLVDTDFATAKKIAKGLKKEPNDITNLAITKEVLNRAIEKGDIKTATEVYNSGKSRQRRLGQEIVSLKDLNSNKAESFADQVVKERTRKVGGESKKSAEVVQEKVKNNVKQAKEKIELKKLKIEEANNLIRSLICKI